MRKLINKIILHPLFASSVVMIVGNNSVNVLNYVYHLIMARLLGPANYGELAALLSLIGLIGIIPHALGLVIIKFTSSAGSAEDIAIFVKWFNKKVFIFSGLLFLGIIIFSSVISTFLNIHNQLFIPFIGLIMLFSLPTFFNRSVLQGLLKFNQAVFSVITENIIKLILGVFLVYIGFSVGGAIFALIIASLVGWFLSMYFGREYHSKEVKPSRKIDLKPILIYSFPIFIQSFASTSLYSADVILVKHFFSSHDAGLYAALSSLGKIIFFGTGPILAVMFPMISNRQARGVEFRRIFLYSLILGFGLSSMVLVVYYFFPELAIRLLYGSLYTEAAGLLIWFGIFMMLFTMAAMFINFYLSLGQTKVVAFSALASVIQILAIMIFHDSLFSVILISTIVTALLLFSLIVYFVYETKFHIDNSSSL